MTPPIRPPTVKQKKLHNACRIGDLIAVNDLIKTGAEPNFEFSIPFIEACEGGSLEVAKYLYNLRNCPTDPAAYVNLPIRIALENSDLELADWLITLPNVDCHVLNDQALRRAKQRSETVVVEWINNQ